MVCIDTVYLQNSDILTPSGSDSIDKSKKVVKKSVDLPHAHPLWQMQRRHDSPIYSATIIPSIPSPAIAAPIAWGPAPAALVPVELAPEAVLDPVLEPVSVAVLSAATLLVIVVASVVFCPWASVVVNWVAQVEALLAISEPAEAASDPTELAALAAADPIEAASPVNVETAAEPPVSTACAMELASEPIDSPPAEAVAAMPSAAATIEPASTPSGVA